MSSGSRLTLYDMVSFINEMYAGERIDLYIIMCLDAIPEATIRHVEESVQEAERPWRGLMSLGRVASSVPYLRPSRTRSRSVERRHRGRNSPTRRNGRNNSSSRPATGWRNSSSRPSASSRPAARPHAKDE